MDVLDRSPASSRRWVGTRRSWPCRPTILRRRRETCRRAAQEQTDLCCSIGVGDTKIRASRNGSAKPLGAIRLTREYWYEVKGGQPNYTPWGIGLEDARSRQIGSRTVAELAAVDKSTLASVFGPKTGPWLRELATGEGGSAVSAEPWVPKGVSRERTFQQDLEDPADISRALTA